MVLCSHCKKVQVEKDCLFNHLCKECCGQNKLLSESKSKVMVEIWWIIRGMIHNGHIQVKQEEKILTSHKKLPQTSCYVCDIIHKLEGNIAKMFGEKEYMDCKKVRKDGKDALLGDDE